MQWINAYLSPPSTPASSPPTPLPIIPLSFTDLPVMLRLLQCQLTPHKLMLGLSDTDVNTLCILLYRAYLHGLSSTTTVSPSFHVSSIHILESIGSLKDSCVYEGLFMDIPLCVAPQLHSSPSSLRHYPHPRTILFSCSLMGRLADVDAPNVQVEEDEEQEEEGGTKNEVEGLEIPPYLSQHFHHIVSYLLHHNIEFLFCQKLIHPRLQQLLHEKKIGCMERCSIRYMQMLQRICGGKIFTHPPQPQLSSSSSSASADFGQLASVEERMVGKRRYVLLTPITDSSSPSSPLCTLHLLSPSSTLSLHARRLLNLLRQLQRKPIVCAGGGGMEISVAAYVEMQVERTMQEHAARLQERLDRLNHRPFIAMPTQSQQQQQRQGQAERISKLNELASNSTQAYFHRQHTSHLQQMQVCLSISRVLYELVVWNYRGNRTLSEMIDQARACAIGDNGSGRSSIHHILQGLSSSISVPSSLSISHAMRAVGVQSWQPQRRTGGQSRDVQEWQLRSDAAWQYSLPLPTSSLPQSPLSSMREQPEHAVGRKDGEAQQREQKVIPVPCKWYGFHNQTTAPVVVFQLGCSCNTPTPTIPSSVHHDRSNKLVMNEYCVVDPLYSKQEMFQHAFELLCILTRAHT